MDGHAMETENIKKIWKWEYAQLLSCCNPTLINGFMEEGGWNLFFHWTNVAIENKDYVLVKEIVKLLLVTPVNVSLLRSNRLPIVIKNYVKNCEDEETCQIGKQLVHGWITIGKTEKETNAQQVKQHVMTPPFQPPPPYTLHVQPPDIEQQLLQQHFNPIEQTEQGIWKTKANHLPNNDPVLIPDSENCDITQSLLGLGFSQTATDFNCDILSKSVVDGQNLEKTISEGVPMITQQTRVAPLPPDQQKGEQDERTFDRMETGYPATPPTEETEQSETPETRDKLYEDAEHVQPVVKREGPSHTQENICNLSQDGAEEIIFDSQEVTQSMDIVLAGNASLKRGTRRSSKQVNPNPLKRPIKWGSFTKYIVKRKKWAKAEAKKLGTKKCVPSACLKIEIFDGLTALNTRQESPQLLYIKVNEGGVSVWACLYCNRMLSCVWDYYQHLASHTGEFMYACTECFSSFPYKESLVEHLKLHRRAFTQDIILQNFDSTNLKTSNVMTGFLCGDCFCFKLHCGNMLRHVEETGHSNYEVKHVTFFLPPTNETTPHNANGQAAQVLTATTEKSGLLPDEIDNAAPSTLYQLIRNFYMGGEPLSTGSLSRMRDALETQLSTKNAARPTG